MAKSIEKEPRVTVTGSERLTKATHAYIGVRADGSVRAIVLDDPGSEADTQAIIAGWPAMGRAVEYLPIEEATARMRNDPSPGDRP